MDELKYEVCTYIVFSFVTMESMKFKTLEEALLVVELLEGQCTLFELRRIAVN